MKKSFLLTNRNTDTQLAGHKFWPHTKFAKHTIFRAYSLPSIQFAKHNRCVPPRCSGHALQRSKEKGALCMDPHSTLFYLTLRTCSALLMSQKIGGPFTSTEIHTHKSGELAPAGAILPPPPCRTIEKKNLFSLFCLSRLGGRTE